MNLHHCSIGRTKLGRSRNENCSIKLSIYATSETLNREQNNAARVYGPPWAGTICLERNCSTSHRGAKLKVEPRDAFVLKQKNMDFHSPRISTKDFSEETV